MDILLPIFMSLSVEYIFLANCNAVFNGISCMLKIIQVNITTDLQHHAASIILQYTAVCFTLPLLYLHCIKPHCIEPFLIKYHRPIKLLPVPNREPKTNCPVQTINADQSGRQIEYIDSNYLVKYCWSCAEIRYKLSVSAAH